MLKKKKFEQVFRELYNFLPKNLSLSSQKYGFGIRDPEKTYSGSRIRAQRQKGTGSRIWICNTACLDLDLKHRNVCGRMIEERGRDQAAQVQKILAGGHHLQQVSCQHHMLWYQG
jgi:hypothetical protein